MLAVGGSITTHGTTTVNLISSYLPPIGMYPLIDYSGSILGSGSAGLALGSLPSPTIQAKLQNDPIHDVLYLDITASDVPKWTGAVNGSWDTTTQNWLLANAKTVTNYVQGENVLFDDTATGTTAVNLPAAVTPNFVAFNNNSLTYTLSGAAIAGPGSLAVTGSGLVVLTNDNTYSGGTTLSAGTLQLGNGGTTGSVAGNVIDNATLAFNHSDSPTVAGTISGSGGLQQIGSGLTTLTASNTYTGTTTISNGTLQLDAGGNTGMIAGNIVNTSALVFSRSDTATYNGAISGAGTVTQAGPGVLIFNGNHSYTGLTTVSAGTLQIGSGGASGSIVGDVAIASAGSALVFARSDQVTYGGTVSGAGMLAQQGPGNLILTGTNTYSGGTQFSGGTVTVASDSNLGAGGNLFFFGGTLRAAAPLNLSAALIGLNAPGGTIDTNGFNVNLPGQVLAGNLVKNGAGTLTLTNIYNWQANTKGSTFTVNAGAVAFDSNAQVPELQLVLNGGALRATSTMGVANYPTQSGGAFSTNILVGPSGGTLDTGSNWVTTLGAITGNGTLTKVGSGTWCLGYGMGGSGFTGNLHIVAGSVVDGNSYMPGVNTDAISNSTIINVDAGATWDDSWGNGEDLGGFAGAGDIIERQSYSLALEANTSTTFSGRILAASVSPTSSIPTTWSLAPGAVVNLTQLGGGSITLTNTGSTFGGVTTIDSGTIIVSANVLPNQTGPLGLANSAILVGNTSGTSLAALLVNTAGVQIGRNVQLQSGNKGVSTVAQRTPAEPSPTREISFSAPHPRPRCP